MFCHGNFDSVRTLKHCLDSFSAISGLMPNRDKSLCYLASTPDDISSDIINLLGFQRGTFPATFLGLPLLSSKLSIADCQPLLQRIRNRILSWTSKFLSYAGRLELTRVVLFSIQNFWASHFLLPSAVIKDLKACLCRFLWKGNSLDKFGAKVSWDKIAKPKNEGGLNIKRLDEWNSALILQKLWQIVTQDSRSSWSSWIHTYNLKGKFFWCMDIPSDCSWCWRKILKVRSYAKIHIRFLIGNGYNTSLWFDPWLGSPLAVSVHSTLISNSGLDPKAMVSSIIRDSTWSLPSSNHSLVIDFRNSFDFTRHCNSNLQDKIFWDDVEAKQVTASTIWNSIRARNLLVCWDKLVWAKPITPRCSFLLWLAYHNAITTKDKLIGFGIAANPVCVLCHVGNETFDHLFFSCSFSFHLMFRVMRTCGWRGYNRSWTSISDFLSSLPNSLLRADIAKLGFSTVVYSIWQERNSRIHDGSELPLRTLSSNCIDIIKRRLCTFFKFQKVRTRQCFRHLLL